MTTSPSSSAISRAPSNAVSRGCKFAGCFANVPPQADRQLEASKFSADVNSNPRGAHSLTVIFVRFCPFQPHRSLACMGSGHNLTNLWETRKGTNETGFVIKRRTISRIPSDWSPRQEGRECNSPRDGLWTVPCRMAARPVPSNSFFHVSRGDNRCLRNCRECLLFARRRHPVDVDLPQAAHVLGSRCPRRL